MRTFLSVRGFSTLLLLVLARGLGLARVSATPVTFSGTITYQGSYSADTLYTAVLDTSGTPDVNVLDSQAIPVGFAPYNQPYSLTFDNATAGPSLFVAALLDVNGNGLSDVFGWYAGAASPVGVSPATSHSGLDFALPRAEIHGTLTLTPGLSFARVDVSGDLSCTMEGFRPRPFFTTSGSYEIVGIYPGTYCVSADGYGFSGDLHVCYGDAKCVSPTPVTLTATQVQTGVDLDFSALSPVESTTWGRVKSLYR
jgi:hypothetical protein